MSEEEKEEKKEKKEHPDTILSEAEAIINNAGMASDIDELWATFRPSIILMTTMFSYFRKAGLSKATTETMILVLWNKLFGMEYGGGWYGNEEEEDDESASD